MNDKPSLLPCTGCDKRFPYEKVRGEPALIDFGHDTRMPSRGCTGLQGTALCLFSAAERRSRVIGALEQCWPASDELTFVTLFVPGRELTLHQARQSFPKAEAKTARELVATFIRHLPRELRLSVRAFGTVEPALINCMNRRREVIDERVAIHLHMLLWGAPTVHVNKAVKKVALATPLVRLPSHVKQVWATPGIIGYILKAFSDHRVRVQHKGRAMFRRLPQGEEIAFLNEWSSFPIIDTEILVKLRHHGSGISSYGVAS